MKFKHKKTPYKRIALVLSLLALILWGILGTGASLAWFTDTSTELRNIFHFADFELVVSRPVDGEWKPIDSQTKLFDEQALYEPGYVQVVTLKVENAGSVSFRFDTAVNVNGCIIATNVFGQPFMLQDHLKFGVTTADSEQEIRNRLESRDAAAEIAQSPLHNYDKTGAFELAPGKAKYLALIVRMPETVDNVANYRGETVPQVELGITVKANQIED